MTGGGLNKKNSTFIWTNSYGNGAGIYSSRGTVFITGFTIDENTAARSGGGYNVNGGSTTFTNCNFSGNSKLAAIGPGGVSRGNSVTWGGNRGGTQPAADFETF